MKASLPCKKAGSFGEACRVMGKRLRCVQLGRALKKTGSFYYHCDRQASHYVKVMLN
jgi:hypothetical protein